MTTRWRITWPGIGAIAIAAIMITAGIMKTINLLILLGDLIIVLIALNAFLSWRIVKRLRIQHEIDRELETGRSVSCQTVLTGDSSSRGPVMYHESSPVHSASAFASFRDADSQSRLRFRIEIHRRGVYAVTRSLECGFPFGFVTCHQKATHKPTLFAVPPVGQLDLTGFRRWLLQSGQESRGRRSVAQASSFLADLRGVRPFRSGDNPRSIHWRSTARRNELLVREFDTPDSQDLIVALDLANAECSVIEDAVSLAATILDAWCRSEQSPRVTLMIGNNPPVTGRAQPRLMKRFLRELAGASASSEPPNLTQFPEDHAARLVVSTRTDSRLLLSKRQGCWQYVAPQSSPAWYHPPCHNGESRSMNGLHETFNQNSQSSDKVLR